MTDRSCPSQTTKQREKRVAKKMGGTQQPASGATPWAKEDVKTEAFLIQHKEVQAGTKSHTLKMDELRYLLRNAIDEDRQPVYMIDVVDHGKSYYLIPEWLFEIVRQELEW